MNKPTRNQEITTDVVHNDDGTTTVTTTRTVVQIQTIPTTSFIDRQNKVAERIDSQKTEALKAITKAKKSIEVK